MRKPQFCQVLKIYELTGLVRWAYEHLTPRMKAKSPSKEKGTYIFFGEIPNMPDHCIVADSKAGKIYSCYHTDNFVELTDDEM
jgi:hypothetical protein